MMTESSQMFGGGSAAQHNISINTAHVPRNQNSSFQDGDGAQLTTHGNSQQEPLMMGYS